MRCKNSLALNHVTDFIMLFFHPGILDLAIIKKGRWEKGPEKGLQQAIKFYKTGIFLVTENQTC